MSCMYRMFYRMICRMSIAVSILIKPSKVLRLMVGAIGVLTACLAILIGIDSVGYFSFISRMVMVSASIVTLGSCIFYVLKPIKTYRIDISNTGQIRLTCLNLYPICNADNGNNGEIVSMMDGSTLWSGLLLLRLQLDTGHKHILRVLPDSVSPESFRMLLVACRWIAAHRHDAIERKM